MKLHSSRVLTAPAALQERISEISGSVIGCLYEMIAKVSNADRDKRITSGFENND